MYVDWDRDHAVKPYVFGWYEELKGVQQGNPELLFVRRKEVLSNS